MVKYILLGLLMVSMAGNIYLMHRAVEREVRWYNEI